MTAVVLVGDGLRPAPRARSRLTLGVWILASIVVGRLYPEAIQRFSVAPNQFSPGVAVHRQQHRDDPAGLRPRSLGGPFVQRRGGAHPDDDRRTRPTRSANARLWDYRPLGDTLDQLQTVRRYYDVHRRRHRPLHRSMASSARSCSPAASSRSSRTRTPRAGSTSGSSTPTASAWRWCRSTRSPTRASRACSSATCRRSRRPARPRSRSRGSTSASGRRRTSSSAPSRPSSTTRPASPTATSGGRASTTRWQGTTGIPLGTTLERLLFALRFRDLDLLISDQVTPDSQLLFHRSLSDRLQRIAPFLRYDKDPYLVVDGAGRLVYVQDAYTTSRPLPPRPVLRPGGLRSDRSRAAALQLHPQQRQDHDGRVRRDDALLRRRPDRPAHPCLCRASSRRCSSRCRELPADLVPHLRVPEELFNVQTRDVRPLPRDRPAALLPEQRPVDGAAGPDERAEPPVRGLLRGHADAGRAVRPSSCCSSRWSRSSGRT